MSLPSHENTILTREIKQFMMSCDFTIPQTCAMENTIGDSFDGKEVEAGMDGDDFEVKQHDIVTILINIEKTHFHTYSDSYFLHNNKWTPIAVYPEALARNKHIFCPLP